VSISSHWATELLTASRIEMRPNADFLATDNGISFCGSKSNLNPPNDEHAPVSRTVICGRHFLAIKLDFNRSFSPWHGFGKLHNRSSKSTILTDLLPWEGAVAQTSPRTLFRDGCGIQEEPSSLR
jgi:hypothetical protein